MPKGAFADVSQADLLVDGKGIDAKDGLSIGGAVLDANLTRSIEQASTVAFTCFDPQHDLLNSKLVTQRITCNVDEHAFSLVAVEKSDDNLILTFEDEAVALLRRHATPRKASRAKMTRAQFAKLLVNEEPSLTFFSTELKNRQPIGTSSSKKTKAQADANKDNGFPDKVPEGLKVYGRQAKKYQLDNANTILIEGVKNKLTDFLQIALVTAAIGESSITAIKHGDAAGPDSRGIFQQRDNGAWATAPRGSAESEKQRLDPATAADAFIKALLKINKSEGPWGTSDLAISQLIHAVQGNSSSTYYAQFVSEAKAIYKLWHGAIPDVTDNSGATSAKAKKPYEFHRGGPGQKGEDSWQCLLRLAEEVNWLCFCVGRTIYFLPAVDLYTSRPIATISEATPGIDRINFQYDLGKNVTQAQITAHAERWQVDPGAVVMIENMGPASGRWLVSEITRSLFDTQASISLVKPTPPLKEPPATAVTGSKATGKLVSNGELNGLSVVEYGISLVAPPPAYHYGSNHPGVSLQDYLTNHKMEKSPWDCSSFARWIWIVGGHVDIGNSNVAGIVAHAQTTNWLKGGPGTKPPGGFKEGDVLALNTSEGPLEHIVVCAGGSKTVEAQGKRTGIVLGDMPSSWAFWFRPEPAAS